MCKDRKKLSNTEQKITKCNKKAFHVEHCKRFTWNIVSVSRGTSQAFHVEHQRRTGEDGCVRLRFFLLLVRACVLGCGRLRSSSLLPPPCSGLRARLWAAALALLSCRPRLCALLPLCVVVCRSPLLPSSPVRAAPSLRRRLSLASLAATFTATGVTPHSRLPTAASRQPTADASLQPPDSRLPTADSRRTPAYSRQQPHASRQPTADASLQPPDSRRTPAYSRQPTADSRRQLTAARR